MADQTTGSARRLYLAYAESSRDLVSPFAKALEAAGFIVDWAQPATPDPGTGIDAAQAVIVCWTPAAVASDAVNLQAARARKARKLVPILLAPCRAPPVLGGRHAVCDLSGWRQDPSDPEFVALVHSIHARLSGRMMSGEFWRSRLFSWGSAGTVGVAALMLLINFGGLKQAYDGVFNPGASEKALSNTDAKVEEVLELLKGKTGKPLEADAETALRDSIARLLSAQSGARGKAADKLAKGDLDGAISDLQATAAEGEKAAAGLAETWTEIGALLFADKTYEAISAYERAVQLNPRDFSTRAQLGHLYMRAGLYDDAREAFDYIRLNVEDKDQKNQAEALGSLGMVAVAQGKMEEAEDFLKQALDLDQTLGDLEGQAFDLGDLGDISQSREDFRKAGDLFQRSLDLLIKAGNTAGQPGAYGRLGGLALARGDLDAAEKHFTRALEMADREGDNQNKAMAEVSMGDVWFDRGKPDLAQTAYNQGLELARRVGVSGAEAGGLEGLGDIAEKRGEKTRAIGNYRDARDIYFAMENNPKVKELDAHLKRLGATPSPDGLER